MRAKRCRERPRLRRSAQGIGIKRADTYPMSAAAARSLRNSGRIISARVE
jgi:hypothetical protein